MTAVVRHLGEVLAQPLEAVSVIPTELVRQLCVPANSIRSSTANVGLPATQHYGLLIGRVIHPQFWMHLQALYDLELVATESGMAIRSLLLGTIVYGYKINKHMKPE